MLTLHDVLANNPPSTTLEMSTKRIIRLLILLLLLPVSVAAKDFVVVIDPGHEAKVAVQRHFERRDSSHDT